MARHLVTFLFLVFAIHVISAEEEVSTNALNEYVSVPRLMQTARQFGDLLDDDTGIIMGVLLFAALGIPLLGLLALGAVLLASSFVYRYAFTGAGLNTNTLANFGTGLNTGITTGTITAGRRKRSATENSQIARGLAYIEKMLDNAQKKYS